MRVALSDGGVRTVVEAPPEDLRWLIEFLGAPFHTTTDPGGSGGSPVVRLERTDVLPLPAAPGTSRVLFAMDREPVALAAADDGDGSTYDDRVLGVRYRVQDGTTCIAHADARPGGARLALMRVVREHSHNRALAAGRLVLHAASAVRRTGAVAIAGPKGSGKTTLLLQLLASGGWDYLSNDRLDVHPQTAQARAVATIVAVRAGTRERLPDLVRALEDLGDFRLTESERGAAPAPPASRDGTWHFSPKQLAHAARCHLAVEAPLAAVVILGEAGPAGAARLAPADAAAALAASTIGHRSGRYASDVFSPPRSGPDAREMRSRCGALAERVPVFSLSRGDADAATIIREITG